jgi:hypothetical protein
LKCSSINAILNLKPFINAKLAISPVEVFKIHVTFSLTALISSKVGTDASNFIFPFFVINFSCANEAVQQSSKQQSIEFFIIFILWI